MKEFKAGGWYLPDEEKELQGVMRADGRKIGNYSIGFRLGYQFHKYEAALRYVKQRRTALDIGAHVGLWSWPMAQDFERVIAFEPHPEHRKCWGANMRDFDVQKASLYPFAVGNVEGKSFLRTAQEHKSGHTFIDAVAERQARRGNAVDPGAIEVDMIRLDDFAISDEIDFIKIDCEGYELPIVQGAENLIKKNRPVIIIEQKPETGGLERYGNQATDASHLLMKMGMRWRESIAGDFIMTWE